MSITLIVIILTALTTIPAFKDQSLFYKLDFSPYQIEERKEWYRFVTHAFIHADWMHLLFNMLVLFFFGDITQNYFEAYTGGQGAYYFALLYLGGILFAVIPTFKKHRGNPNYHSVGASGAVSAVFMSSVFFSPLTSIYLYALIPLPGIVWAIIYLIYTRDRAKKGGDNINHDAHFWGSIYGVVFTMIAAPQSIPNFFAQFLDYLPF